MTSPAIATIPGRALPLRGRDIDTDRIMPARFLRAITFDGLETHLFADDRAALAVTDAPHPFDVAAYAGATVLVVESNFGCGSSREHAPQAIRRWGIRAVLGESFGEIFRANALQLGLPCVSASPADIARLLDLVEAAPDTLVTIDLDALAFSAGPIGGPVSLPAEMRAAFRSGSWDVTAALLERYEEVEAVEKTTSGVVFSETR